MVVLFYFTESQLTRKAPASYSDGVYTMTGDQRPSPRTISQALMKGSDGLASRRNRTALHTFFGKGPSINDISSEGEGGGPPSKPIYYISLFSNLSRQGEGGGS